MKKVLIVDSNTANRTNLIDLFSNEYEIITADSVKHAVSIINEECESISAILLNIYPPDFIEFEILKQKQNNILFSIIPTIVLSDSTDQSNKNRAISLGVSDFIIKPFNQDILTHSLKSCIDNYQNTLFHKIMYYDNLTGIYNRDAFFQLATKKINDHKAGYYSLSSFDVESFKVINDQYGTDTGDMILKYVAECIERCCRETDGICCRITGDNFAMMYPTSDENFKIIQNTISIASVTPYLTQKIRIRIGIYHIDDTTLPVSVMYDRAEMASETIKGRYDAPCIIEYNESMRSNIVHEQKIVNNMHEALEKEQFEPWFQPQYNHVTGAMIGAEALVRWKKDDAYISPAQFVPVFEKNGFIYEMDKFIWESVCKLLRKWIDKEIDSLPVSVNISRRDLFHTNCVSFLADLVKKYNLPYDLLRLEVTESAFSESSKIITAKVEELINIGFTVEIDDFGSGYSSLNTLKDVPASILKLDMKFFDNTENLQRGGNIIESVVRMAKWLGMSVIAEGVEKLEQADYLKSIGCYYIQGYFYSKPVPLSDYEKLLDQCQKEHKLIKLKTLDTLNNNEFWNPKSMETLIFNSYVGGACIFEFHNGITELLRVNERYSQELGYFKPDGTGLSDNNININLDKENKDLMINNILNAIKTQKESFCMLVLSDPYQHTEYIRSTVRVIAQSGDRYLLYCVIVNISDQVKAEQMRLEAERRESKSAQQLNMIMENINGGVCALLVDDDGHSQCVFTNDNFYKLFGYTKEQAEAENLDIMTCIHPGDFNKVISEIKKLKHTRKPILTDFRCKKRNGETAYLRANSSLMSIEGFGNKVISSVICDITDEATAINKLMLLNDNIPGGLAKFEVKDDYIKILYLSEGVFRLTGYTKDELLNLSNGDAMFLVSEKDKDMLISMLHTMLRTGENMDCNFRAKLKSGKLRWVNIRSSISEINEQTTIINVVFLDIMERKLAEEKLNQNQHDIIQKYEYEQQLRKELLENSLFSYTINLTKEIIEEYTSKIDVMPKNGCMVHFSEELYSLILSNIISEDSDMVKNTFFTKNLLNAYKQNKTKISIEYRRKVNNEEYHWVKTSATIVKHPDTNEIIAFLYAKDIDTEKKNQIAVKSIINKAIDALSLINVRSGLQRIIISKPGLRMIFKEQIFNHDEMVFKKMNTTAVSEDDKKHMKEMLLDNLISELNSNGHFIMTYKIIGKDGKPEHKRSYAYYLDETHDDIILSERSITN